MKKEITITLDPKSIDNAIKELEQYKAELRTKTTALIKKLTDYGANIVRAKLIQMKAIDTHELLNSVGGYYDPKLDAGFIRVTCDYAVYVEFGTGVVGGDNPHPSEEYMSKVAWKGYAVGPYIFTTKDGKVGWMFPTDDGTYRFTEGMPSRPFMYETGKELEAIYNQFVKEVFG